MHYRGCLHNNAVLMCERPIESMDWNTLYTGGTGEIEEKKSRFIATIEPVSSEEEAAAFIASVKKKYWDARHNCSAYVIGDNGQKTRCSDDGEPSGTAGRPMLDVLTGSHITNACVVVTRYFGGTLLGTGGLVRAYSAAVKEGLEHCGVIKKINGFAVEVKCDYNDYGRIDRDAANKGYLIHDIDYGENVSIKILTDETQKLIGYITDLTSGKAVISEPVATVYAVIDGKGMIFAG